MLFAENCIPYVDENLVAHNPEYEIDDIQVSRLPDDVFYTIAELMPKNYKKLLRFLDISENDRDQVWHDNQSTLENILQVLNAWCQNNPCKKWKDIKLGLIFCERKDVIAECEKKLPRISIFNVACSSENDQAAFDNIFLRGKDILKIHEYLRSKNKILVLCGMSGVGKTQIARKYCEIYEKFYKNIIWINSAFGKLRVSMNNLCQKIGCITRYTQGDNFDIEVIVDKIHNYFQGETTLYVFDNVDDESVKGFEMYISKKKSFTLITSQWRSWSDKINQMPINVFTFEEALNYTKNNIKPSTNEELERLIKELRFHPFAINQAVKYIKLNKISVGEYINCFKSNPVEILDTRLFQNEEKSYCAITAIKLVLMKLLNDSDFILFVNSLKILNFLSYCDGQNISKHFLNQISKHMEITKELPTQCQRVTNSMPIELPTQYQPNQINDAVQVLVNYSLLERLDDGNYSMHDLTQISCKDFQRMHMKHKDFIDVIIEYFEFEFKEESEHSESRSYLVFHFIHLFRTNTKKMSKAFYNKTTCIKKFLICKGLSQAAIEIFESIQKYVKKINEENDEPVLIIQINIASCFYEMGKFDKALDIYRSVDKILTFSRKNVNRILLMQTKNDVASCLCNMGSYELALKIYCIMEKEQSKFLDANHDSESLLQFQKSLLTTRNNIASCLHKMGQYYRALEYFYSIEKKQVYMFGENSLLTLQTKSNIATSLDGLEKHEEALEIYNFVDKIQTIELGINHPKTIETKNYIANSLIKIRKLDQALNILYPIEKTTELLGVKHPLTMDIKISLATCLKHMGEYNEALEMYCSVEEVSIKILGINHLKTMDAINSVALCLYQMREYQKALEKFYIVDKIQSTILGFNRQRIMTKYNISCCLFRRVSLY